MQGDAVADDQGEQYDKSRGFDRSGPVARSKAIGETVEDRLVALVDELERVPDADVEYYDAETVFSIDVDELEERLEVPVVTVGVDEPIPAGTPVEIKAARYRVSDGSTTRRGRFFYRRRQHSRLREAGAVYAHGVYGFDEDREEVVLLGVALLAPDAVDDVLGSWVEVDRRETSTQSSWGRLPFPDAVERAGRHFERTIEAIEPLRDGGIPAELEHRVADRRRRRGLDSDVVLTE